MTSSSTKIAPDSFDSPDMRSSKVIGASAMRAPRAPSACVISTWKPNPVADTRVRTPLSRRNEARCRRMPAVASLTGVPRQNLT